LQLTISQLSTISFISFRAILASSQGRKLVAPCLAEQLSALKEEEKDEIRTNAEKNLAILQTKVT
jgi:hypothetical protein